MTEVVRSAGQADVDAIARIYVEASLAALGDVADREAITDAAQGRHAMWAPLLRPAWGHALDVFDDGAVRGFVSLGPAPQADEDTGHLFALYVEPSRWNEGIGSLLHDRALEHFHGNEIAAAELWVQEENARARSFYEDRQWQSTGETRSNSRGNFIRYAISL